MDLGLGSIFLDQNSERNRSAEVLEAKSLWFSWEEAKTTSVLSSCSTKK